MSDPPAIAPKAVPNGGAQLLRVGDLLIDLGRQRVTRGESVIGLPKLSYELMIALVRAAPNLVSTDALMEQVWPKAVVSPETLSQRIKLLRDALGDDPRNPRYVEGLRGRGYRLIPSVEGVTTAGDEGQSPGVATAANAGVANTQVQTAVSVPLPKRSLRPLHIWAGVIAVALISGVFVIRKMTRTEPIKPRTSVEVVAVQPRAVAVLPFDNLSSAPDNDYIAMGMADSVLHQLASLPELIVVARSSSFALGRPTPDARESGRRLGVRYLVEGSVQRAGKALRVTAQLIDTTTNNQLWSLKVERSVDDVFLLQDQIAQRVAQELDVTLNGRAAKYAQYGTDAYLAFLKGRALIESRKVKDVEDSIRQFSRAIELAPSFAAAITELARAKLLLASLRGDLSLGKIWLEINALVDRAIEIDSGAGEPYFLRAQCKLDFHGGGAEADFRKGLDLAPNFGPGLRLYASYLFEQERYDESLAIVDRARLVDPLVAENHYLKGEVTRRGLHRPEEAAALYLQALAVAPDFYPAYARLGQVRFEQGRLAEAIKYGEKSIAIEPSATWTRDRVVWFYVDVGDLSAARDVLRGHISANLIAGEAVICYRAGNLERAELLLHKNISDPDLDPGSMGLSFLLATDAVVERAIAMHTPATARQFILSIPGLEKERTTLSVVGGNFPQIVQLATLEHFAGNRAVADDLAKRTLEFFDHGGSISVPGADDMVRAWALALLGRTDAALSQLENLIRSGNHAGWWDRFERNPAFADLRATPRFQAIAAGTRIWLQREAQLLAQMRLQGEVPRRQGATITPNGC
ncbi:MAG TPA: winged helix-turn-helix domain-containing protein [Steroidobacteraceae bacterium]